MLVLHHDYDSSKGKIIFQKALYRRILVRCMERLPYYISYTSLIFHAVYPQKAGYNCNLNWIQITVESPAAIRKASFQRGFYLPALDHHKPLKFNSITGIERWTFRAATADASLYRYYKLHWIIQFLDRKVSQEVKSMPWQVNDHSFPCWFISHWRAIKSQSAKRDFECRLREIIQWDSYVAM